MVLFSKAHPLIKLTTEMVANTLGPEMLAQSREEFQLIDRSEDGTLSFYELNASLASSSHIQRREVSFEALYNTIAIERSHGHTDELSYREFVAASIINRVAITEDRLSMVFNTLDPDRNGYINADGIRKVLGEDISDAAIESMVHSGSSNVVRFDGFLDLWYDTWQRTGARKSHRGGVEVCTPMEM